MAHDIIGLDLGSSEVRAVVVRMTMRGVEVTKLRSEPVSLDENGRSNLTNVMEAAGRLKEKLNLSGEETVYCAAFGEAVSVRRVSLPLGAAKKLEQVVKFEIDEVIPFDINDAVFDFVETGREGDQLSVVSAAMLTDQARVLLQGLEGQEIIPRELGVATLCYGLAYFRKKDKSNDTVMVVDLGHERTDIAVLDSLRPTVRTVLRGGRDLTERLAKVGGVEFTKAEEYKKQHGLTGKVGDVLRGALKPLLREIGQTVKGHLASGGKPADKIVLCGGGALLKGLDEYIAQEIGMKVERHAPVFGLAGSSLSTEEASTYVLAYALALREDASKSERINLRQGELEFKGDYEFLKRRIGWVAVCALAMLFSWIFASYAEYSILQTEVERERTALVDSTKRLFGKAMTYYKAISEKLVGDELEKAPIPKRDAFDILVELSRRIPKSVVHDLELLEIKSKRITLKGIVDEELYFEEDSTEGAAVGVAGSAGKPDAGAGTELSPADLIKEKLAEFNECFTAIRVGKVTSVENRRRYSMDIDSKCP